MGSRRESVAARARWVRVFVALLAASIVCGTGIALAAQGDAESPPVPTQLSDAPQTPSGFELDSKRTATSETFRLPNGSFETRIYESPVHYRDAEGDWTPIDEGLEPAPRAADAALTNGENEFDVSLPARMGAGPVRIDFGDEWLSSELSGPSSEPVQLEGQAASYEAANPGVTFSFSSLANGVKEEIEIAGPSEPSAFSFELSASLGLTPLQGSNGEITFLDGDNNAVAVLPAPLMTDSTPTQPAVSQDVYYELEALSQQRWRLTVKADREWLEQPERIWPVVIDPTVAVKSPALDCTIFGGPHETYSGFCGAFGWGWNRPFAIYNTNEKGRSLLRFDLSSIPSDAHVADATLGLHAPAAAENTAGVQLRRITNIWNYQVTWR